MIENYVWLLLLSVNLFAISSIMTKYLISETGGPLIFLLYQLMFGLPFLLVISYFEYWKDHPISNLLTVRLLYFYTFISLTAFLGFITLLNGFNEGNVSVGGIILSSRVVFSVPLAILFLSETYRFVVYISIIIAIIGSIIVSWDNSMNLKTLLSFRAPGIRWYFLTSIFWSLSNFLIRSLDNEVPTFTLIVIRQILMLTLGFGYYFGRHRKFAKERKKLRVRLSSKLIIYVLLLIVAQGGFIVGLSQSLTVAEGIGVSEGTFTLIYTLFVAKFINNSVLQEPLDKKSVLVRLMGAIVAISGTFGVIIFSST